MLRHAQTILCLAILPILAAAASPQKLTVYGRAPVGAFGVDTIEHVEGAANIGMTLIYSYNPGEQTIVVLISLEDTAKGWWQRSIEIPPRVPMVLRVPMDEARLSVDPAHIQRWLLWEADPPAAVEFRLGTPRLAQAASPP